MTTLPSARAFTVFASACFGVAILAAGCGGNSGVTTFASAVGATSAPGVPNATAAPGTNCASFSGGVAYIPDGVGSGTGSLTLVPFEHVDGTSATCQRTVVTTAASIGALAIGSGGSGIALDMNGNAYGLGGFVAGGVPFTRGMPPINGAGSSGATSVAVVSAGNAGFAVGPDPNPTAGFAGVNNFLMYAPGPTPTPVGTPTTSASALPLPSTTPTSATITPVPNPNSVPYVSIGASAPAQSTVLFPAGTVRGSVALGPDGSTILVRGTDLAAFQLQTTFTGYVFAYPAAGALASSQTSIPTSATAGLTPALGLATGANTPKSVYAHGLMAFFPGNATQAVVGQTSTSASAVTVVTGLPTAINPGVAADAGATVTSVAVSYSGTLAAVGTSAGVKVFSISGSTLTPVAQPSGAAVPTGNIVSVGLSTDGKYLLALVAGTGGDQLQIITIDSSGRLGASVSQTVTGLPASTGDYMMVR